MNVLEKIFEDIEKAIEAYSKNRDMRFVVGADKMANKAKEIIISHMNEVEDMHGKRLIDASDDWIPVEERLPEEPKFMEDSYIVQQKNVIDPFSAYWDGKEWTDVNDDKVEEVIAWQPLPEPYKPKKQD